MIIRHLSLSNFRIFQRLEIDFPTRLNLLVGGNAQGKTSILEAVHVLSLLTSPLAGHDREMVNFHSLSEDIAVGRITAEVEKESVPHAIEVRLILSNGNNGSRRLRKEVLLDGVKKKLLESIGFFNSVLFLPQMTRIIEDGPDERRKYLDQTLSQAIPGYVEALSAFNRALTNRNALLKQIFETGSDPAQLDYWDGILAMNGAVIMLARKQAIDGLTSRMAAHHTRLTDGKEGLRLSYLPSLPDWFDLDKGDLKSDSETLGNYFLEALKKKSSEEIRRGVTTIGPHRDDMTFIANGLDLGVYGSRGQIRTAIMSLKLSEVYWLKDKTGETPVLLLDETLAELDNDRRTYLLEELKQNSQSLMTTTDLTLFDPSFVDACEVRTIRNGILSSS